MASVQQCGNVDVAELWCGEDQCHPRKLFIGGLAHKTTTQQLRDHFARHGPIVDAVVLRWPDGRSRGFGYVTFAEAPSANAAMQRSHRLGGRVVDVKRAVPGTNKLFVGGLPQNTTSAELRDHFEAFGVVSDTVVMIDPTTGRSRGFGFVCFLPGQEGAQAVTVCLEQYQNHRIRGKWVEVKSAAPPHKLAANGGAAAVASGGGRSNGSGPPTPPSEGSDDAGPVVASSGNNNTKRRSEDKVAAGGGAAGLSTILRPGGRPLASPLNQELRRAQADEPPRTLGSPKKVRLGAASAPPGEGAESFGPPPGLNGRGATTGETGSASIAAGGGAAGKAAPPEAPLAGAASMAAPEGALGAVPPQLYGAGAWPMSGGFLPGMTAPQVQAMMSAMAALYAQNAAPGGGNPYSVPNVYGFGASSEGLQQALRHQSEVLAAAHRGGACQASLAPRSTATI